MTDRRPIPPPPPRDSSGIPPKPTSPVPAREARTAAITAAAHVLSGRDAYRGLKDVAVLGVATATLDLADLFTRWILDGTRESTDE